MSAVQCLVCRQCDCEERDLWNSKIWSLIIFIARAAPKKAAAPAAPKRVAKKATGSKRVKKAKAPKKGGKKGGKKAAKKVAAPKKWEIYH